MSISCSLDSKCNQVAVWLQEDNWLNEWKRRQADKWCDFSNTLSRRWEEPALGGDNGVGRMVQLFSSVQSLSHVRLFVTPGTAARQASLSITKPHSLFKLKFIMLVMPSNHLILCHPLLLPPSIFPNIKVFSNESALRIRWPKYWSFSFNICASNEYSGLISFRMDWLDLLEGQETLKSLLLHHSSKASILHHSAFFTVQLSCPYPFSFSNVYIKRHSVCFLG